VRETPQYKAELFLEHENVCNFFRKIMFLLIDSVFLGKSIGILLLTVKRSSVRLRYSPPIIASLSVILLKGFFNMEGYNHKKRYYAQAKYFTRNYLMFLPVVK
jgi:hypothetical protein